MIRIFIALLIISIILINLPFVKNNKPISISKDIIMIRPKKNNCIMNTIRGDSCLNNKYDKCPMSTYKQCSNNNLPISKCLCNERSFELCPIHHQYSEKCAIKNFEMDDSEQAINYPINNSRVNMYRTEKTKYEFV